MASSKEPKLADKHVGARVRMRRLMLGMSQDKLAGALGLTFQQVQKYEKGTNRISVSRVLQIAEVLQAPVSFFLDGIPQTSPSVDDDEMRLPISECMDFLATKDGLAMTRSLMRINDPKLRRKVVELVEHMVSSSEN